MAVAALVLGIVSFFCFGPLAGVPAIVLGLLGLSKAKEVGTGKGMSIAGIVLGAIGSVAIVVAFIAIVAVGDTANDTLDRIGGPADTDDYELTTDACDIDSDGYVTFSGTIENTGDRDLSFSIEAEIRDADDVLVDSPSTIVDVPEGDTVAWDTFSSVEPSDVSCQVTSVDNFFN